MPVALRHKRLAYPGADDTDDTAAERSRAEQSRGGGRFCRIVDKGIWGYEDLSWLCPGGGGFNALLHVIWHDMTLG